MKRILPAILALSLVCWWSVGQFIPPPGGVGSGTGDMTKLVYDSDDDGVIDAGASPAGGLTEAAASLLYQATNSALTALAGNPQLYQATNAALTALAGNSSLYQATNANLTALAGNPNLYQATNENITINTGTPSQYELPMYLSTTGKSVGPSGITTDGAGGATMTDLSVTTLTVGSVEAPTLTLGTGTVTNNVGAKMAAPANSAVVDMTFASRIVTLDGALTVLHSTNGIASTELTQVLYLRAGGANRALTIPAAWTTNAFSAVPANITNAWTTKMYVTSIGATDAAGQTNVFVSFEYFKNQ